MAQVNHIHLMSAEPRKAAQWYADFIGAEIVGEVASGWLGTFSVKLTVNGLPLSVTSAPPGQTLPRGTSRTHYGLDHFGFYTDNIEALMARLESSGVEVLQPITDFTGGSKFSYVRGPDNVRVELEQPGP